MKALKIIGIILLIVIVLILVIGIFLPSEVVVEANTTIKAPAKTIFKQVNTMENWEKWTPFTDETPDMVFTYEGVGVGAIQTWDHEGDSGKLIIVESIPYEKVNTEVDFYRATVVNGFWTFNQAGDSTNVNWKLVISNLPYPIGRYSGLFMKNMMLPYLKNGLENIKSLSEELPDYPDVEETVFEVQPALVIKDTVLMSDMGTRMGEMMAKIQKYMKSKRYKMVGPPFTMYYSWWPEGSYLAVGFPTAKEYPGKNVIEPIVVGPTQVLKAVHNGPYEKLPDTYGAIEEYAMEFNKKITGAPWEIYLTDPSVVTDPNEFVTLVYFPIE